ncbi:MAG: FAD:protein FMN transferase [Planctomycetota bacterium]
MDTDAARRALLFVAFLVSLSLDSLGNDVREFRGRTMGTTYMVKVAGAEELSDEQLRIQIDLELRRVNDEMSTYLKASEITKFNESSSTEWFSVSADFARVVEYAQQVAEKTGGAFDVTVGPLVNAWSFGTTERTQTVPTTEEIDAIREIVGYQKLSVRLDPPALRKSVPELRIDLSSIAKGHGVDRVVRRLGELGAENVFVEVGGEVRTAGSKPDGVWKVGIQQPDANSTVIMVAHEMVRDAAAGNAMATSGDYRNAFIANGQKYSHTIDPRTGSPVTHSLASVTVVAPTCMEADAWATALNVIGTDEALLVAESEGLHTLLITRVDDAMQAHATGTLTRYLQEEDSGTSVAVSSVASPSSEAETPGLLAKWLPLAGLSFAAFVILLVAMGIGVLLRNKPISGSCGGIASKTAEDGSTSCSLCSNPSNACKELRDQIMQKS